MAWPLVRPPSDREAAKLLLVETPGSELVKVGFITVNHLHSSIVLQTALCVSMV